ncbi:MAG TPA: glycoside hydrolase family 76 protein [Terriglobales bacterium]|nr:glycoside hydrolase family 76 protein [Terriglobales bacterium]
MKNPIAGLTAIMLAIAGLFLPPSARARNEADADYKAYNAAFLAQKSDGNFVPSSYTNALWASGIRGNLSFETGGNLPVHSSSTSPLLSAAFTSANADTLMNSYNNAFYAGNNGKGYFKNYRTGGGTGFWQQAEEIEAVEDAYERSGNYRTMIVSLLNGFASIRGSNWSSNIFNDDIMWATIAFARGYQITGDATFLSIAETNYAIAFNRGWDPVAGGLFWTTAKNSKNACVEGPGSIAAHLLYEITGKTSYRQQSAAIFNFLQARLWNSSIGNVYDNLSNHGATTYNQGTFIRAAELNGNIAAANLAAKYLMSMGSTTPASHGYNIMPNYKTANNNSGFNSIAIRWVARFMKDKGLQSTYLGWLQANAQAAWNVIRISDDLSWQDWHDVLPGGTLVGSWDCVSSVTALQDVPPPQ